VIVAPVAPLVQYSKPPGTTLATPSNLQVQGLCSALAPLAAEALAKYSAYLTRICLMPQQEPASGYSSLGASYTYVFAGPTTVTLSPATRNTFCEQVPVDLTVANPTLIADLANRMGAGLAPALDNAISSHWASFSTNTAQGTAATPITSTVLNAAIALLANTGEPIFLAAMCGSGYIIGAAPQVAQAGVPPYAALLSSTETLANGASPTANLQNVWVVPTPSIVATGTSPITEHNLLFTPSAFAGVFEIETNINNTNTTPIANCSAVGHFGNVTVTVWALNSASGVQTIYCSCVFGSGMALNANGVVVKS
jgi:hypothetical protein